MNILDQQREFERRIERERQRLESAFMTWTEFTHGILWMCPVCHAVVPEARKFDHEDWHKRNLQ